MGSSVVEHCADNAVAARSIRAPSTTAVMLCVSIPIICVSDGRRKRHPLSGFLGERRGCPINTTWFEAIPRLLRD